MLMGRCVRSGSARSTPSEALTRLVPASAYTDACAQAAHRGRRRFESVTGLLRQLAPSRPELRTTRTCSHPAASHSHAVGATGYLAPALNAGTAYVYSPSSCFTVNRTAQFDVEINRARLFDSDRSEMRLKDRLDFFFPYSGAICRGTAIP